MCTIISPVRKFCKLFIQNKGLPFKAEKKVEKMKYETYFNILYSVLPFHSFEIFSKERISLSKHTPYTIHQDQAFLTLLGFTYAFT